MTNEQMEKEPFQNGAMSSENSSGSDSDNFGGAQTSLSSCSAASSTSSGTTSKLAARMADKVSLHSYPAEKRFKFEPNEDYLDQLLAMGISINGAKKVRTTVKFFSARFYSSFCRPFITRGTGAFHWPPTGSLTIQNLISKPP